MQIFLELIELLFQLLMFALVALFVVGSALSVQDKKDYKRKKELEEKDK